MSHSYHRDYNMCVTSVASGVTSPCKAMLSTAVEEKAELRGLTDELACLLSRMRTARQSVHTFDATSYKETIMSLEDELTKVKNMYEAELCNLRYRLEQASSCRASTNSMYESSSRDVCDLKTKLSAQTSRCEQLEGELCCARSELNKSKQITTELSSSLDSLKIQLSNTVSNCKTERELEEVRRCFEYERKSSAEAQSMICSLQEKLSFETRLREQTRGEMNDRLKASGDMVASLELKIKEMSSDSFDYKDVLAKLRAGTANELERYKAESEEALNRNLQGLRMQIESEKSVRSGMVVEKERMEQIITELRSSIACTEGQMAGLIKQRDALEDSLRSERARSCKHIQQLEVKLSQMNDVMLQKVKECTTAREAQVSLKTEIDAFKALLKEGHKKMDSTTCNTSLLLNTSTTLFEKEPCTYKSYHKTIDTDLHMTPRPPCTPRRMRPTSAHASCYNSTTRIAPVDDRVFHSHAATEYRSSAGTGSCTLRKSRCYDTDDIDIRKSNIFGKRVTVEFEPDAIKKVSVKDDFEICGKGISTCYAPAFPKNTYCEKSYTTARKSLCRPKSSYCIY